MWLCDVLFLLFVTTSSGLLVTEIPESELNVSCRLRPELVWILQLGAVADDIEALLLAGVAGDKNDDGQQVKLRPKPTRAPVAQAAC